MTTPSLNPFRDLRESHNITLELMAKKAGISKQALIRLEQGCYVDPLPTALNYYASAFPITEYQLGLDYAAYQEFKRALATRYFGDFISKLDADANVTHPMRVLRGSRNPTQVAKDLCIPPATLTYFERNVVQQKSVPKVIVNVLKEIGYYDSEIITFCTAYRYYRERTIRSRVDAGKRVTYGYQPQRGVG